MTTRFNSGSLVSMGMPTHCRDCQREKTRNLSNSVKGRTWQTDVAAMEKQFIQNEPIQYYQLQKYTDKDPILQKAIRYIHEGWPSKRRDPALTICSLSASAVIQ